MRPAPAALPPPAQVSTDHRHGGKAPAPPPPPPGPAAPRGDTGDELCPHRRMETFGGTGTAPLRCQGWCPSLVAPAGESGETPGALPWELRSRRYRCRVIDGSSVVICRCRGYRRYGGDRCRGYTGTVLTSTGAGPLSRGYPGIHPPSAPGTHGCPVRGDGKATGEAWPCLSFPLWNREGQREQTPGFGGVVSWLWGGAGVDPALDSGVTLLAVPRLPRGSRSVGRRGRTLDPDWAAQPR